MPTVKIHHDDGSTETIPETVGWERKRELGKTRRVTIDVNRDDARAVTLEPKQDAVDLGNIDTVRLTDVITGGATWRLVGYSLEWDANRVKPTGVGDTRSGTDQEIINSLISDVPAWTAGTIENLASGLEFTLNHSHRHGALRRIERNVPGEIQFRDEGTVDYVGQVGTTQTINRTVSFSDAGEAGEVVGVSGAETILAELWGPGGGDTDEADGGVGGYLLVEIDVSGINTITLYPGEGGGRPSGGVGLYDGGDGGDIESDNVHAIAGGGASSTSLTGDGIELAHADGGGGAFDEDVSFSEAQFASGGGGARGGEGGDSWNGEDAEGSGFGGDGNDGEGDLSGEDAGQEVVNSRATVLDSETGGGNTGDGEIRLEVELPTLSDEVTVTNRGRELDGTHFRVIGDGGETPVYANLVPDDDPDSYDNRVDYSTDKWSPGDDKDWDRWVNRDVTDQSTIETLADSLGGEISDGLVEAKAVAEGQSLSLGDSVRVRKPEAGIDRLMRVQRISTVADGATIQDELLLSTRATARKGEGDDLRSITQLQLPWS